MLQNLHTRKDFTAYVLAARSAPGSVSGGPAPCAPVSRKGWVTPSFRLPLDSAFGLLASSLEVLAEPEFVHDLVFCVRQFPWSAALDRKNVPSGTVRHGAFRRVDQRAVGV